MWARVKGETENALLKLPFRAAYMFRPGTIAPLHGIKSKTRSYRLFYALAGPLLPWMYSRLAQVRHHHRAAGARDARGRQARRAETGARNRGHQPALMWTA